MKFKSLISLLSLAVFSASILSGCNTTGTSNVDVNSISGFNLLDDAGKTKNPELMAELKSIKALPEAEREAKIEELKEKYPELANRKGGWSKRGHGKRGDFGKMGGSKLGSDNPEFTAEMKTLREESKAKREAIIAKYPEIKAKVDAKKAEMEKKKAEMKAKLEEQFPGITADLEGIKDLPEAERKAKMEELKAKYPDFKKSGNKRGHWGKKAEAAK